MLKESTPNDYETKEPKLKRFSVTFAEGAYDVLSDLARDKGTSLADTIRDAVTLEKWAIDTIREGGKIILRSKDGSETEILLR